jgi:MoxR-like ATPase
LLVKSLGSALGVQFERIQFTPDLLPSDVVGTMVFQPKTGEFSPHRGPVFANLVLADEINRAPAKVQSALLEAMQERQVTIGGQTHPLPSPFFVMATQNPIEQEGTYPLPEAQTDRFLFKLLVDYPSAGEEAAMMQRWGQITEQPALAAVSSGAELLALRAEVDRVHVAPVVQNYILTLVRATRALAENPDASTRRLNFGASPRASLALYQAGRSLAWLRGLDLPLPRTRPGAGARRPAAPPGAHLRGRGPGDHIRRGHLPGRLDDAGPARLMAIANTQAANPLALLRQLEWRVRHAVENILSGEYRSAFRGRGMEFDQVVRYEFGDDVRDIDWNVTARLGEPYRKKFVEEREVTLLLVSRIRRRSTSGPGRSPSGRPCSSWPASSCCSAPSTVTASASSTPRRTGPIFREPVRGRGAILHAAASLIGRAAPSPAAAAPEIPWRFIARAAPKHSVLLWLGDFPPRAEPEGWVVLRRRYQTMGFRVDDPWERELPREGRITAYDPPRAAS